jgi:hypothetical protein
LVSKPECGWAGAEAAGINLLEITLGLECSEEPKHGWDWESGGVRDVDDPKVASLRGTGREDAEAFGERSDLVLVVNCGQCLSSSCKDCLAKGYLIG